MTNEVLEKKARQECSSYRPVASLGTLEHKDYPAVLQGLRYKGGETVYEFRDLDQASNDVRVVTDMPQVLRVVIALMDIV